MTSASSPSTPSSDLAEMKPEDWSVVSKLPGNSNCIDCNAKYPEWGSVNFGILFCTRCCSGHRSLGTHISRVRSIRMDAWTEDQVQMMRVGGNQSCQEWFAANGIILANTHKIQYDNETAKLYTQVLKARVEGRQEPKFRNNAKSKAWYQLLVKGEEPNDMVRQRRNVLYRFTKISSSSDFWLYTYATSIVVWLALFLVWKYQGWS